MGSVKKPTAKGAYDAEGHCKYLSRAEGRRFVLHATKLPRRNALFCLAIYYTGCRLSEALALRRQDIDSELKAIRIRSLKKRGKLEIRRVPVPAFLLTGLIDIGPQNEGKPLWPFSRTTVWRLIKSVMAAAEISGIHATAKGLHHGFGVRGALVQIPVSLIQSWMGHADPSTTAIYLAVKDDEERSLMEKTW